MSSRLQSAGRLDTNVVTQYVWGARTSHRDELVLRDGTSVESGGDSGSSDPFFDDRLWCLMDYYDPTSVVDNSGAVVERYRFSAFGLRSILAPDFSPRMTSDYAWDFAFKGQFLDLDTGYYNYGYRYYSPELGRWLSRDPIEEKGGVNGFAFTMNNSINKLDLLGLTDVTGLFGETYTVVSSFELRFPKLIEGVKSLYTGDINSWIVKHCGAATLPNYSRRILVFPNGDGATPYPILPPDLSDNPKQIDQQMNDSQFGDRAQSTLESTTPLGYGRFQMNITADFPISYKNRKSKLIEFTWKTTLYALDTYGDASIGFETNYRPFETQIAGSGACCLSQI